jgi:uncharacterized membrane protein YgcG
VRAATECGVAVAGAQKLKEAFEAEAIDADQYAAALAKLEVAAAAEAAAAAAAAAVAYVGVAAAEPVSLGQKSAKELKAVLEAAGVDYSDCVEKQELVLRAEQAGRVCRPRVARPPRTDNSRLGTVRVAGVTRWPCRCRHCSGGRSARNPGRGRCGCLRRRRRWRGGGGGTAASRRRLAAEGGGGGGGGGGGYGTGAKETGPSLGRICARRTASF